MSPDTARLAAQASVYMTDMDIDTEKMKRELELNDHVEQRVGTDIEKRKNSVRNIPCPICYSGKKFKKCCW